MSCLEITTAVPCSNGCSYCPQKILLKKYGREDDDYMTFQVFTECVSKVPKNVEITFSGYAECFQNPAASAMIRWAVEQGYTTNLYTTLKGCRDSDIDTIRGLKFQSIVLHMPDRERHMICDVDDNYLRILRRFRDEVGYSSAVTYGVSYDTINELLPNMRVSPINWKYLHTRAGNVDYKNRKIDLKDVEYKKGKIACSVAKRHRMDKIEIGVLLPNGNVQLCCHDYSLKHTLGNLISSSYESLFSSEAYKKLIRGLSDESIWTLCRTCPDSEIIE